MSYTSIYENSLVVLFVTLISPKHVISCCIIGTLGNPLIIKGCIELVHNVLTYDGEDLELNIFSFKINLNQLKL
jgi:hypothetical protein